MKYIFKFIIFSCVMNVNLAQAQLNVTSPFLSPFFITPESIVSGSVISVSDGNQVIVSATIINDATGELVIQSISAPILLKKGVNTIVSLNPNLTHNYGLSYSSVKFNHTLPNGTYRFCFHLHSLTTEEEIEECEQIISESEILLNLIYPLDLDTISTLFPNLSWLSSSNQGNLGLSYLLILTEVQEGQSPEMAIMENAPILSHRVVRAKNLLYPTSATRLIPGHHYVWQVELWEAERPVLKSEIWSFFLEEIKPDPLIKFVVLRRNESNLSYDINRNKVYFTFAETQRRMKPVSISIIDSKGYYKLKNFKLNPDQSYDSDITNHFTLDTEKLKLEKGQYKMIVQNQKNERYEIKLNYE